MSDDDTFLKHPAYGPTAEEIKESVQDAISETDCLHIVDQVQLACRKLSKWRAETLDEALYHLLDDADDDEFPLDVYAWDKMSMYGDPKIHVYVSKSPPSEHVMSVWTARLTKEDAGTMMELLEEEYGYE